MKKTISIVIPVYNMEAFLAECLDSVVGQTYPHLQILCVNDGSRDRSQEILEAYAQKDPRIVPIVQENGGLSAARNRGLEAATGEYVMFLDSDDWLEPDICRLAVEEMEASGTDLVMWSYVREYRSGSRPTDVLGRERLYLEGEALDSIHRRLYGLVGEELADPSGRDILVTAWGKLYRRELIRGIGFIDTKKIGTEDCMYNILAFSRIRSAVYLPVYGCHYRKYNEFSLTTVYNPHLDRGWEYLYELMEEKIRQQGLPEVYRTALSNRRSLSVIGLGVNVMAAPWSGRQKRQALGEMLRRSDYREALGRLDIRRMPVHWRAFFRFCRWGWTWGVYLLLAVIQKIRGK